MSGVTAQLTDEEVLGLRSALLATFDSRAERAELDVAPGRSRRAKPAPHMSARSPRARAAPPVILSPSPPALRRHANAISEREAELAKLRMEAKLDIAAEIEAKRKLGIMSSLNPCSVCELGPSRSSRLA